MSLTPGIRLGAFEVTGRLGAGAMGEVYRARDVRLGREVAIKILPAEFASHPDRRRRFEQESRAASALSHPNIVTVYDVGDQDGLSYIVSELVEGESLRDLIDRGPLPLRKAVDIGAQIADGLAAAHAAGVVHRDLKPENIMLTRDGRAKILDFGLARYQPAAASAGTMTMTQPGMVMGTAGYMSPEQVLGTTADAPSDIFSLGVILYEMLTGKSPFPRPTTVETMSAILRDDPAVMPDGISPAVQQVILHCLEKEPGRRFQSAPDLAFNLRALAPGSSISGSSISGSAIKPSPARQSRPLPWLALFAAACALLAAASTSLLFLRPAGGPDLSSYRFTPLAVDAAPQHGAAWSPDGKNIAYVRDIAGHADQVLVRNLSSLVPTVLCTADGPRSLFWSPDGTRLFFVTGQGVWSVSRAGGEKQQVLKGNYFAATLSPDGKTLALWLVVGTPDKSEPKVWISSPPGAAPRAYQPATFESVGSFTPVYMQFSPDGKQILIALNRGAGPRVWLLPFPDGAGVKPRQILGKLIAGGEIPTISWMPDSRHFVMSFYQSSSSGRQLWMADSRKETIDAVTAGQDHRADPAVSPDGKKIAFDSLALDFDIVEMPVAGGPLRTLLASSRDERFPAWSPTSPILAYVTDRSGRTEIWLRDREGSDRPLVTQSDFPNDETLALLTPAISPDGERIAYGRVSDKHVGELWISPMAGGTPLRIGGKGYEIAPAWSPDGKWLSYFSSDSGVMRVSAGGADAPVSLGFSDGCENVPQWSPDSQWIACATENGVQLVSPDGQQHRTLGKRRAYITWSRDGKQIYALGRVEGGNWRFGAIDAKTGQERAIYEYGPETHFSSPYNPSFPMSLTPDGAAITTTIRNVRSDIWLLEGFERK